MLKHLKTIISGFILLSVMIVMAQETCSAIVEDALLAVDDVCGDLGRNQACYGNVDLTAEAQSDTIDFVFESSGDIVDVGDIFSLQLSELNEELGTWGVAVMSLQADIPNTLPGQNVTFILFGDVFIENASTDEQSPMQAFYLRTGVGEIACEDAPESGLLIQSPEGVDEVSFNVNGVDVQVGSTVLFETESMDDGSLEMVMSPVEGSLAVQFDDENFPAVEGTSLRLPLNEELLPDGRPGLPESYDANHVAPLPIAPLPRGINLAPPLPGENLNDLRQRIQNGQPPCGVDGLPPCENILPVLREGGNMPPPERWGARFEPGVNCIVRPEATVNAENLPPVIDETQSLPFCPPADRANRPPPTRAIANNELPLDGDADNDEVRNVDDACPMQVGTAENNGCSDVPPDSDGDGFPDALDFCPRQPGDERGCPDAPIDSDGDGFPDALDFCPNRAGTAEFRGCPSDPRTIIGDSDADCSEFSANDAPCPSDIDGDGIPNGEDACPARPGLRDNDGCPSRDSSDVTGSPAILPTLDPLGDADGDGVLNGVDNCPARQGLALNNGCPRR